MRAARTQAAVAKRDLAERAAGARVRHERGNHVLSDRFLEHQTARAGVDQACDDADAENALAGAVDHVRAADGRHQVVRANRGDRHVANGDEPGLRGRGARVLGDERGHVTPVACEQLVGEGLDDARRRFGELRILRRIVTERDQEVANRRALRSSRFN